MRREINKQKNYDTMNERLKTVLQYNSQSKISYLCSFA